MSKTQILNGYINRIASLNDQLWYFLFTSEELNRQLSNFTDKAKENYTIDLFKNNVYAPQIHVKTIELPKFQRDNKHQTFGAYFSTCYEISSNYFKDVFDTLKSFNSLRSYNWDRNLEPEKNLINLLAHESLPLIPVEILDTYTYLRLRRNHFTHLSTSPNPRMLRHIAANGYNLNTYWRSKDAIRVLDFTNIAIEAFTQDETIELIKILRICLNEIDAHIASLIKIDSIIEYIVKREYSAQNTRINHLVLRQRNKKIIRLLLMEFNITVLESKIIPFTSTIGIK